MENKSFSKRFISLLLALLTVMSVCYIGVSATIKADDEYPAFLDKLGYIESRNTYNIVNSYGYMGRWQLGHTALIDIGFMDSNYKYTAAANKYGVYSDQDFLNSPDCQDAAIVLFDKKLWGYILWYGDDSYVGKTFNGVKVTVSGLVAAGHLLGAGGVHKMLTTGDEKSYPKGTGAMYYLETLAGYNISKSIGSKVYDPTVAAPVTSTSNVNQTTTTTKSTTTTTKVTTTKAPSTTKPSTTTTKPSTTATADNKGDEESLTLVGKIKKLFELLGSILMMYMKKIY